jgi:hypothetical protein
MAVDVGAASHDAEYCNWYSHLVFRRAVAAVYVIAFAAAVNQFLPLLGDHGLLPVSRFVAAVPFLESPSLFYLMPHDAAFRTAAWAGVLISVAATAGLGERSTAWTAAVWSALWVLYVSFINVGQTFYGFGWETLLAEVGFYMIFAGSRQTTPSRALIWLWRWTLFRLMFGAGLIKLRGDSCWRDLTCLDYYFETQPMPNPLSWHFHWLPPAVHHAGVVVNHIVEVGVPFAYFAPQPFAAVAGAITIAFQLVLIVSGNLSWLNWLTIVLALTTVDDRWLGWMRHLRIDRPELGAPSHLQRAAIVGVTVVVAMLSVSPVINLLSSGQLMNASFNPVHLVNTYGAFGSITRQRDEIVIEGTSDETIGPTTVWREYEFKGKPGDLSRRPPQVAPYHLRLDWLMWFAAMTDAPTEPWFETLLVRLLENDPPTLSLLRTNPFAQMPPRFVRALHYIYRFTTPDERRRTGQWWKRELVGTYYPPASLR